MRRLLAILATVIVSLLGFAVPSAAGGNSTLPAGFTPNAGPCGSGYTHIGHYAVGASPALGHLDVYWSSGAKRNCLVVNHSSQTWGVSLYTEASIRPSGYSWPSCPSSTGCDGGFYRYYAGPVYTPSGVNMSGRCLDVRGYVDWASASRTRIHCG